MQTHLQRTIRRSGLLHGIVLVLWIFSTVPGPALAQGSLAELRTLVEESRYEEAIELARTQVDELRATGRGGSAEEAAVLDSWVEALYRSGAAVEPASLELAERAVALRYRVRPIDSRGLVSSLLQLGNLYYYRSEPDSARAQYSRALEVLENDPDPDEAQFALALNNLGVSWKIAGDYARALEYYEEALSRREALLGPDHPDVAASLNNLANVHVSLGDHERATRANERALAIREGHYGPENEWVAESLNNLASVLSYDGRYEEALAAQERAVGIFAVILGEDHERYWTARMNLAAIYADLGDHRGAVRIFEDVLELQRRHFGEDHIQTVEVLDGLAASLAALSEFERAESLLNTSLSITIREYGEGSWLSAYTLQSLGECLAAAGRHAEAIARFEEALGIWESELAGDSPELSELMHLIARSKLAEGEVATAADLARRSAENIERGLGPDHPLLAEALRIDALASRRSGDTDRALDSALRAEDISRRHASATIRVLSESRALDMAMSRTFGLDLALSLLDDEERSERTGRVYDALIRSRALHFDELASRHRSYGQADEFLEGLVERVRDARARLANLTLRGPGWEEVSAYRQMIEEAREEKALAERALARASAGYRQEQVAHEAGLPQLRSALHEGALVVSCVHNVAVDESSQDRYVAFVLAAGETNPRFVVLGSAGEVHDLVTEWRQQAAWGVASDTGAQTRGLVRRSRQPEVQEQAYDEVAVRVRRKIWDPVVPPRFGGDVVYLVADGNLHLVSPDAFVADDGSFLVENGPAIRRIATERSLATIAQSGTRDAGIPRALLVGGPDYGPAPSRADPHAPLVFEALPGARREVGELDRAWRQHFPDGDAPVLLTGAGATEAAFKEGAAGRTVLHLATHGYVLADARGTEVRNPLLRAGLAFAGANQPLARDPGADDGILTAEELAALDLSRTEWAVLSACDTGLGEIAERGEGVFGLARALQIAGARTVIMSLWAVDDQATLDWMLSLYEARLEQGLGTDDAVRQASIRTIQARREAGLSDHPFYWAAFISSGDWR